MSERVPAEIGSSDAALERATAIVDAAGSRSVSSKAQRPEVAAFFDETTFTVTYVVHDAATREAVVIDSVLDFDPASGRIGHTGAQQVIDHIGSHDLKVSWHLETHVHADHISAAAYLQERIGGRLAIGAGIVGLQHVFGALFGAGADFARDGSQFDRLFTDGETFRVGGIEAIALHVPGHTPADMAYVIGDAVFIGDTLFMPDYGTARTDFPGGDAGQLYHSIRRLLSLPRDARLFLCHDYKAPGRDAFVWETTVGAQRDANVHVHDGVTEHAFVAMRTARDATLPVPKLILPSVQVNMRGGRFPAPEGNGVTYLKLPVNAL